MPSLMYMHLGVYIVISIIQILLKLFYPFDCVISLVCQLSADLIPVNSPKLQIYSNIQEQPITQPWSMSGYSF